MKSEIYQDCLRRIKKHGERFPKKHGEWYRIKVQNKWLLLDTWSGGIYLKERCEPSGKDIYGGVVCFCGENELLAMDYGELRETKWLNYWRCHLDG